jgi:hypothetical protein
VLVAELGRDGGRIVLVAEPRQARAGVDLAQGEVFLWRAGVVIRVELSPTRACRLGGSARRTAVGPPRRCCDPMSAAILLAFANDLVDDGADRCGVLATQGTRSSARPSGAGQEMPDMAATAPRRPVTVKRKAATAATMPTPTERSALIALRIAALIVNALIATPDFFPLSFSMFRLGASFGLLLAIWDARRWRDLGRARDLFFVAGSVTAALLAEKIGTYIGHDIGSNKDLWAIEISGAVLLASAQRAFLGSTWTAVITAAILAPGSIGLFYAVHAILPDSEFSKNIVLLWQAGYFIGIHVIGRWLSKAPLAVSSGLA